MKKKKSKQPKNSKPEEEDDDEADFRLFAMQNLARAWDDDEPDLFDMKFLKLNPNYEGLKKDKSLKEK